MLLDLAQPKEIVLRDYQSQAIEGLRQSIARGKKRLILCATTGAGKTICAAHMMRKADAKGSYALFVVDRVALIDQTSAVFDEHGLPHGIIQGSNPRWSPFENIQVCSAQTLANRALPRDPSLFVIDECHVRFKTTNDLMDAYPNAVKIGLTATPFTKGLSEQWDDLVNVIPSRQLIEQGYLVEPTIYVAQAPDDDKLTIDGKGEFSDASATSAGIEIIGDVVKEWEKQTQEHFGGPVKTIVFSPTVEHGQQLCTAFSQAGHNFQQVSYMDKSDEERALKIAEFRRPDSVIVGLVSCGVLTRGFDVPDTLVGIACRPYRKSLSSHMQEVGRVMRSAPGKTKALWLDHAGNMERFGVEMFSIWNDGVGGLPVSSTMDSKPRERNETEFKKAKCGECGMVMSRTTCAACGWERPARSTVVQKEGELREFRLEDAGFTPRSGLRAAVTKDAKAVWEAALSYTMHSSRHGEAAARRWAYGIFRGIYPENKLPYGWYDMAPPALVPPDHWALIEREVRRFRKSGRKAA